MTFTELATIVGTGITVIGFVYMFFRNFKQDINSHIDKLENRLENRINALDLRINALDERMFYLSTGRSLQDAILSEKLKLAADKEKK